jgi:hypothetical protein
MMDDMILLIRNLINRGHDEMLLNLKKRYLKYMSFSQISTEIKEIIEEIDFYFICKSKILEIIPKQTSGDPGIENVEFDYEGFHVISSVYISGSYDADTHTNDLEFKLLKLQITFK